ncbi:MAG: sulfatase, partial [Planctomycetales bacterium 12-60-4]
MYHSATDELTPAGRQMLDRRDFFEFTGSSLSAIALTHLLSGQGLLAAESSVPPRIDPARPMMSRPAHFPAAAKNVVVIFCAGACSQLETWDYKPELIRQDGKPLPGGPAVTFQGPAGNLARPQYEFRPYGETGKMVSDMIPHLAQQVDDFAFIHSLTSKSNTHGPAENFLSTGFVADGFPSIGAWVTYALGTENQDLPAFVAIPDPRGIPQASVNNWAAGFLPAVTQGTPFNSSQ